MPIVGNFRRSNGSIRFRNSSGGLGVKNAVVVVAHDDDCVSPKSVQVQLLRGPAPPARGKGAGGGAMMAGAGRRMSGPNPGFEGGRAEDGARIDVEIQIVVHGAKMRFVGVDFRD